jgi:hypothetical protein
MGVYGLLKKEINGRGFCRRLIYVSIIDAVMFLMFVWCMQVQMACMNK